MKPARWKHQDEALQFAFNRPATMLSMAMGCISGDAEIVVNRAGNTRRHTLRELHRRYILGLGRSPWKCRALVDGQFRQHTITNVIFSGVQPVVRVSLDNGKFLVCTPDHQLGCPGDLWVAAQGLSPGDPVLTNGVYAVASHVFCIGCGKPLTRPPSQNRKNPRCRNCYRKIMSEKGDKSRSWKGGRCVDSDGYARLYMPSHPRANPAGQVYEHIVVMEAVLGRPITTDHEVHHKNEIKTDNRPENLELLTKSEHRQRHIDVTNLDGGGTINGGTVVFIPKIAKVVSVEPAGEIDVYDISMADPWNNFVANGVVVHNCGKSRVVCDLVEDRGHLRTLVVCPVSVLGVWRREFAKHSTRPVEVLVLDKGTTKDKVHEAHQFVASPTSVQRVVVVNYETAWREPFGSWSQRILWDLVVADESHRAKSPTGKASKWLAKMRFSSKQRLALSGTPMPHSPLDIFAQYRFLDPEIFGRHYTHFRSRYAVVNQMFPSQVRQWINQEELGNKVATIAFQVGTEVLDLPDAMHETRTVELCPKARRIYTQLEKELIAEVETGVITVSNALTKLLRLQQLTGGWCPEDDGPTILVDTAKRDALEDLLEDLPTTEPVVVFCRFRQDLRTVKEVSEKLGRRFGELSGERKYLTPNATMPDDVDLLAVQVQSGGVGIDLTRAAYCVYYSIGFSLGDFLQSLARVHRPGQTRPVRYYHLIANNTVDGAVYGALEKRKEVVGEVLKYLNRKEEPCSLTY